MACSGWFVVELPPKCPVIVQRFRLMVRHESVAPRVRLGNGHRHKMLPLTDDAIPGRAVRPRPAGQANDNVCRLQEYDVDLHCERSLRVGWGSERRQCDDTALEQREAEQFQRPWCCGRSQTDAVSRIPRRPARARSGTRRPACVRVTALRASRFRS